MLSIYTKVKSKFAAFSEEDRGATAVEYALIVAAIALVVAAAAFTLGGDVSQQFTDMSTCLTGGGC